jgi:transposase
MPHPSSSVVVPRRSLARKPSRSPISLGISESCLRSWVDKADVDEGGRDGVTSADRAELVELRRKLRVAEMEKEILRRATA